MYFSDYELLNFLGARDVLRELTGVKVRLVGDPSDCFPIDDADTGHQKTKNVVHLNIRRHIDDEARSRSIAAKIEILRGLVMENLHASMFCHRHNVEVIVTFDGYEADPREVIDIPEVRDWMRSVFILGVPQAIRFLSPDTYSLAAMCCNKLIRTMTTVGPLGSPGKAIVQSTEEWVTALYLAGMPTGSSL